MKTKHPKMIQVNLTRAELEEFVGILTQTINDDMVEPDQDDKSPLDTIRRWRTARQTFIADGKKVRAKLGPGVGSASLDKFSRTQNDWYAATVERLYPVLEAAG